MATNYQRAKRRATLVSAILAAILYSSILLLPALGGYVTAETPIVNR